MNSESMITIELSAFELDIVAGILGMHLNAYPAMGMVIGDVREKLVKKNREVLAQIEATQGG